MSIEIMIIDTFSEIGSTHRVCEDYSFSFNGENESVVVISDGCSSSKNTDFGSRIISAIAVSKIIGQKVDISNVDFFKEVAKEANQVSAFLGLNNTALDATLLVALYRDKELHIATYGDGSIIEGRKNGQVFWRDIYFPQNAPFYINYFNDEERRANFDRLEQRKIESYILDNSGQKITNSVSCKGYFDYFHYDEGDLAELSYLILSTDGIGSFFKNVKTDTSSFTTAVPLADIVREITKFKNLNRGFLQRRMNAFSDFCKENEWSHYDDFTVGAFSFA